jgi:peptidyl-prolyl cis-trans isomerase A (cyclophilin A)
MSKLVITALLTVFLAFVGPLAAEDCGVGETVYPDHHYPKVKLKTTLGDIVIELNRRRAPITVNNFLHYVKDGRYAGTIFHRVVAGFVVQGGGYRPDLTAIETLSAIFNESGNGLNNAERSVAMARHDDPHSATSQFYFNLADNDSLDPERRHWGYTVFGTVMEGWEVVQQIAGVETGFSDGLNTTDVPIQPVIIEAVELMPNEF